MTQIGAVFLGPTVINLEFPCPDSEISSGVTWGSIDAFPSPAYWAFQVLARRLEANQINYRLGQTLREEVAACLLGGHGIPAAIGLAAFRKLKSIGILDSNNPAEDQIYAILFEPLEIEGKPIRYRFARQKARYLAAAMHTLATEPPPLKSGKELRDWLLKIPGIGYKTASWIARNWLDADDVAILDIHILRAGLIAGFFPNNLTVERDYLKLEKLFIEFSQNIGVRASELDALIWHEMQSSSATVFNIINSYRGQPLSKLKKLAPRTNNRQTDANQAPLFI